MTEILPPLLKMWSWLELVLCFIIVGHTTTSTLKRDWVTESPVPLSSAPAPFLHSTGPTAPIFSEVNTTAASSTNESDITSLNDSLVSEFLFTQLNITTLNITSAAADTTAKQVYLSTGGTTIRIPAVIGPLLFAGEVPSKSGSTGQPDIDPDEYYSAYPDYPEGNVTASGGSAVLPEPEAVTGEEEIPLPDDSLADTDLHDHDLIDSVMYIYFGASGHDQAPPGRQVLIVGAVMALVAQFLTLAGALKKVRSEDPNMVILINTELALTLSNLLFMLGVQATGDEWTCSLVAMCLHYLHLVSLSWLCATSLYCYCRLASPHCKPSLLLYTLVTWTLPALLVYLCRLIDKEGYETRRYCWMSLERGMLLPFMVPVSVMITTSTVVTVAGLRLATKAQSDQERRSLTVTAALLPMFSSVWFLSVLALDNSHSIVFPLVYVVANAFLNWFVLVVCVPSGGSGRSQDSEDELEDELEDDLLYDEQTATKDDHTLLLQPELYIVQPRDDYELQMDPICTISS
ncbi:uncharacterized protein isoform X2 [Rhodnius prolixus]|uniref:uncharacterized protein isoform X2 n=1 Tax=Rhodnius prolixus TaxID=13249 RepID=UPI003D188E59